MAEKTLKDKTVLVVEDELPLAEAIKIKLERSGFGVVTARTSKQALNLLRDVPKVDAIWLDHYLLGQETGLDFVVEIKKDKRWRNIPILVVSNSGSGDKVQSYLRLGVEKYYVKSNYRLSDIISEIKESIIK
jgi:two-component system phosphate regulon response regulator PhoB